MYYPKRVPAGTVIGEALSCVDFLPTIATIMGFETAGEEEGRDASALFLGEGGLRLERHCVPAEHTRERVALRRLG